MAVAVVALVALVAGVGIALTRDDGGGALAAGSSTTSTSTPRSTTTTTQSTTTTTAPPAGADRPSGVPSDWVAHQGDGWRVWHPVDWSARPGPASSVDITSPDGDYLRIDTVDQPSDDPRAAWVAQEQTFAARHPDYQRIRIDDVDYQNHAAAIWEFTFEGQHAADLGFSDNERGYALDLVAGQSRWDGLAGTWQAFQDGFEVSSG